MAIKDEISRLQQAKQDFKTKLIEKGVAVSDEELISDYPPKLDLIKGSATVTKPGEWQGTAVPNSGMVESVYFNTNLSIEEVVGLLEGIEKQSIMGNTGCVVLTTNNHLLCALYNEGVWAIGDLSTGAFYFASADVGSGFTGWDSNFNGVIEINEEVGNIVGGEEVVFQNDELSSLFSTTPFTQSEGEQITLEGDYDGSTLVLDELPKGGWQGSFVPNEGYVDKVYFNTSLSVEEVVAEISKIRFVQDVNEYPAFMYMSSDYTSIEQILIVNNSNGQYILYQYMDSTMLEPIITNIWANHPDYDFTGWNPNFNGSLEIKFEPMSNVGIDVGTQNDVLSSLISITPFVESKPNTIDVKALIEQKKIPLEIEVNVEEGTDTTDATATANEIRKGFTAYVSSGKVEGAIEDYDGSFDNEVSGELVERSLKKLLDYTKTCASMFKSNTTITDLTDYFEFSDTSSVTSMAGMFYECGKLTKIPLFDTSKVTDMNGMFMYCNALTTIPQLDTSNVKSMENMFNACSSLTEVPLLNTSKVTKMSSMFYACRSLTKIDISYYGLSSTSYSNNWCTYCYSLKAVIIRELGSKYTLNSNAFNNCCHILGTVNATYNPNGDKDGYIYVPRAMVDTLKSATNWSTHASQLRALEDYTKDGTTTGEFDDEKAGLV